MSGNGSTKIQAVPRVLCAAILLCLFVSISWSQESVKLHRITGDNYKTGYISNEGKLVIPPKFENASDFQEGVAAVEIQGKYGFINTSGKLVIPAVYKQAYPFSDGGAFVVKENGEKWYIDKTGKTLSPPKPTSSRLIPVRVRDKFGYINAIAGKELVLIDASGGWWDLHDVIYINAEYENFAIEPLFDDAREFHDGLAFVKTGDKWGVIDKTGKMVIPTQFASAKEFSEGLAGVQVQEGGKWGFIDKTGAVVIKPAYDDVQPFSEGLAVVMNRDTKTTSNNVKKHGYIDKTGNVVIPLQFVDAESFSGGLGLIVRTVSEGVVYYINKKGKILSNFRAN